MTLDNTHIRPCVPLTQFPECTGSHTQKTNKKNIGWCKAVSRVRLSNHNHDELEVATTERKKAHKDKTRPPPLGTLRSNTVKQAAPCAMEAATSSAPAGVDGRAAPTLRPQHRHRIIYSATQSIRIIYFISAGQPCCPHFRFYYYWYFGAFIFFFFLFPF